MSLAEVYDRPVARRLVPPQPPRAPDDMSFLKRMRMMRHSAIATWTQRAYEEDVIEGNFFGRSSFILNTPDAIKHVLVDNWENYTRTPTGFRVLRPMLGQGLLIAEGRAWKHQRRTLAPAFTPRAVSMLVPHMIDVIDETVAALKTRGHAPVDLRETMQRMTLEVAGRTMFSFGMERHGAALRNFVMEYADDLARPHLLDIALPLWFKTPQDFRRARFRKRWTAFIATLMAHRRAAGKQEGAPPRDLFELMEAARDPETGKAFTDSQLGDEVATEANNASAALDAERLKFTRAVIDETLRLYPSAFLVARAAYAPDIVAGRKIKAHDVILMAPWILHRHERLWQEPNAFLPQRFMAPNPPPERFAYLPFGAGPRVCIGAHFAQVEATLALAKLIGAFRVELVDKMPVIPTGVVTTQPDRSPQFVIEPR